MGYVFGVGVYLRPQGSRRNEPRRLHMRMSVDDVGLAFGWGVSACVMVENGASVGSFVDGGSRYAVVFHVHDTLIHDDACIFCILGLPLGCI